MQAYYESTAKARAFLSDREGCASFLFFRLRMLDMPELGH